MNNINNLTNNEKEIIQSCTNHKPHSISVFSWQRNKTPKLHKNFANILFENAPSVSSVFLKDSLLARNWLTICPDPVLSSITSFLEDGEADEFLHHHTASKQTKNQILKTRDWEKQQQEELCLFFSQLERSDEKLIAEQRKKIEQFAHTITHIELSYMSFNKKKLDLVRELFPNLATLKLEHCRLNRNDLCLLSQFQNLHHLFIPGCNLSDNDIYEITRQMPGLITFDISHNALTYSALYDILAYCRDLQGLNIQNSRLKDSSFSLLERLAQRKITVNCSYNDFSEETANKLKAFPSVTVDRIENPKPVMLTRSKRICTSDFMKFR